MRLCSRKFVHFVAGPVLLAAALAQAPVFAADVPDGKSVPDIVKEAPKGSLKNPYKPDQKDIVEAGHKLFMSYSCNGCHGGTGGGGICPQLNGDVWFFGIEDDTLFRLIAIGSIDMQKDGFQHLGGPSGTPMPPFGTLVKSDDEIWKMITWIRSIYKGDPKKKTW
jgi:mono/diheme cytochrome c family protein